MASVNDVASFFIDWANKSEEEHMTNLWLNKLLFFSQGHFLARYGKPLFTDPIEAWKYGPVVPSVYRKYSVCGRNPISAADDTYDPAKFTLEERTLLADVLREYGKYTASALVAMTHKEGTPWSDAYVTRENNEITQPSMKEFFEKPVNQIAAFSDLFSADQMEEVGVRDKSGFLVLPKDEDDGEEWDEL
jgi:uncharacterized phage-associated protein